MKILIILFTLLGNIGDYMQTYRQSGQADYSKEQKLLETYSMEQFVRELSPLYTDTLISIRQKSYDLICKKGLQNDKDKTTAIINLLKGCDDPNDEIVEQVLYDLQGFAPEFFNAESRSIIAQKLSNDRMPHLQELILLAGFINVGEDILHRQFLNPDLPKRIQWYTALALARMGNKQSIDYCLNQVRQLPLNNDLVGYVLPDLIYTRQKQAMDYCIELMNKEDKLCYSLNPNMSEKTICGYQIIALLAPVIVDFPVLIDASGDIITNDYQKTWQTAKKWFLENKDYTIRTVTF